MILHGIIEITNVAEDTNLKEILDLFHKFGKITSAAISEDQLETTVILHFKNPFDAADAVKAKDGYELRGFRMQLSLK